MASSLGDINLSWFDDDKWNLTIPQETEQNREQESDNETIQDVVSNREFYLKTLF